MKKLIIILSVLLAAVSCGKFPHEGTATESLAGRWMASIYYWDGLEWVMEANAEYRTYNTAANIPTEMWIDDGEGFWGTNFKVDCDAATATFGSTAHQFEDLYAKADGRVCNQKLYGGKITKNAACAPVTKSTVDKIEFYISFSDDSTPFATEYYVVGYRYTGFPEDDDQFIEEWPTMPEREITAQPV